jgi:hypothetical protein
MHFGGFRVVRKRYWTRLLHYCMTFRQDGCVTSMYLRSLLFDQVVNRTDFVQHKLTKLMTTIHQQRNLHHHCGHHPFEFPPHISLTKWVIIVPLSLFMEKESVEGEAATSSIHYPLLLLSSTYIRTRPAAFKLNIRFGFFIIRIVYIFRSLWIRRIICGRQKSYIFAFIM